MKSVAVITYAQGMVRWESGARARLHIAALDLFARQGFEQTTAAEIAGTVGLSERTFFRHFADKREVLFDGQAELEQAFLEGMVSAPAGASPLHAITAALDAAATFFRIDGRKWSRQRQAIIDANPALQERELLKLAGLARLMTAMLQERGVPARVATLAAESGVTVFGVAFAQWIEDGETREFRDIQREVLSTLSAVIAG